VAGAQVDERLTSAAEAASMLTSQLDYQLRE
jgi:hypothetical protein